MFTGLIESIGQVKSLTPSGAAGGGALAVDLGALVEDCRVGDSVAISGACLTATRIEGTAVTFALSPETLAKSTLASLRPPAQVNIERAMKATDRFGGHIVQGHVDGTGTIRVLNRMGEFADIGFDVEQELLTQMVPKGSVAIDGVSLTVAGVGPQGFRVAAIPETLDRTTLGRARIGQRVNVEVDIVVKIVRRQLEAMLPRQRPLTAEKLQQMGY
jgi:riboflavin synthase